MVRCAPLTDVAVMRKLRFGSVTGFAVTLRLLCSAEILHHVRICRGYGAHRDTTAEVSNQNYYLPSSVESLLYEEWAEEYLPLTCYRKKRTLGTSKQLLEIVMSSHDRSIYILPDLECSCASTVQNLMPRKSRVLN